MARISFWKLKTDVDMFNQEMNISHPTPRILSATHSKFKDEKGRSLGSVTIFRDISGQKEVEFLQKDVVSRAAHELRSSLISIKGFLTSLIRNHGISEEEKKSYLRMSEEESYRLGSLVENLLDLSRIETGQAPLKLETASVVELVDNSLFVLKPQFDEKKVRVEKEFPADKCEIELDKDKFIQVIHNLLSNALKFTPENGKVTVSLSEDKEKVVFKVSDTGIGIPKKDLPHIFDKFYRVRREMGGVGLGLSIVRELVKLHQGDIRVESEEGKGTTAIVTLPLRK